MPQWPNGVGQMAAIVGSVIRTIPHSAGPGKIAPAGEVALYLRGAQRVAPFEKQGASRTILRMTKVSVTEVSSAVLTDDPGRLATALDQRQILDLRDRGYVLAPKEAIAELADAFAEEELLEEMVSYRKNVTGVDNTVFISPKGNTRHAPRIKIAIDPPDSVDPRGATASIAIADGAVMAGDVPRSLQDQASRFVALNHDALIDYWDYKIDTDELRRRLKSIAP